LAAPLNIAALVNCNCTRSV